MQSLYLCAPSSDFVNIKHDRHIFVMNVVIRICFIVVILLEWIDDYFAIAGFLAFSADRLPAISQLVAMITLCTLLLKRRQSTNVHNCGNHILLVPK